MAKYTSSLTSNVSVKICDVHRVGNLDRYEGTVMIGGTFGAGTVLFQVSPDAGTTKFTIVDPNGQAITANTAFDFSLAGQGGNNEYMQLYATISGATSPAVTVTVFDNR